MKRVLCRCLLAAGLWWTSAQQVETAQFETPPENADGRAEIDAVFTPPSPEAIPPGHRGARVGVAASFIKGNMPWGWGWTVTDKEAFDVAAYINRQPRCSRETV